MFNKKNDNLLTLGSHNATSVMKLNSLISFLPMHSMLIKSNNQYGCSIVNNGIRRLSCSRKADDSFQGWGWWAGGWKETKNDAERQKMELLLMQFLDFQLSVLCLFFFGFHNVSKKNLFDKICFCTWWWLLYFCFKKNVLKTRQWDLLGGHVKRNFPECVYSEETFMS